MSKTVKQTPQRYDDDIVEEKWISDSVIEQKLKDGKVRYQKVNSREDVNSPASEAEADWMDEITDTKTPTSDGVTSLDNRLREWVLTFVSVAEVNMAEFISADDMKVKAPKWAWQDFFNLAEEVRNG